MPPDSPVDDTARIEDRRQEGPVASDGAVSKEPSAEADAPVSKSRKRLGRFFFRIALLGAAGLGMAALVFAVVPASLFDEYARSEARLEALLRKGRDSSFRTTPHGTYAAIALVSQEDRRIYERRIGTWAVPWDVRACARAAIRNLSAGRIREGCSTLAMQVAKLAMPTDRPRRSVKTKLMQMRLAWQTTQDTPDAIIGAYLEALPCASSWARGLRTCALLRFGREAQDLSAAEVMVLASAVQAPGRDLQPTEASHSRAQARLDRVLTAAVTLGMMQKNRADAIRSEPIGLTAPSLDLVRAVGAGWDLQLTDDLRRAVEAARANALRKQGDRDDPDLVVVGAVYDAEGRLLARVGDPAWFARPVEAGSWVKPFVVEALMNAGVGRDYLAGSVQVPLRLPLYSRDLKPWDPRNAGEIEDVPGQPMAHVMRSINTGTLAALLYAFVYLPPSQSRAILEGYLSSREIGRYQSSVDRQLSLELMSAYAGVPLEPSDAADVPGYRQITLGATRMALGAMKRHVPGLEVPHEDLAALLGVVRAPARDLAAGLRRAWVFEDGSLTPLAQLMAEYARQGTLRWLKADTPAVYKTATAERNAGLTALTFDRCSGAAYQVLLMALRPSGQSITPVQGGTLGPGYRALLSDCREPTPSSPADSMNDDENLLRASSEGS